MNELETDYIFIEADQAIYSKVLDVMFALKNKGEDFFPTIVPCTGGFHTGMCMLRTIYSLFGRCGIVKLLSSAGLGGLGTVKKALTYGNIKEIVNLYENLYETLLRTKIKYIEVTKCDRQNVVKVSYIYKKEKYITNDELRKGFRREIFEDVIVSGNIESLPNSAPVDMG